MGIALDVAKIVAVIAVCGVGVFVGMKVLAKTNVASDMFGDVVNGMGGHYDYPGDWWLLW